MKCRLMSGTAAAVALAASLILAGCGDGGNEPANVAGEWSGTLALTYIGGGSNAGALELHLEQEGDFAAGSAVWGPNGTTQSVSGQIEGDTFALRLDFRCPSSNGAVMISGDVIEDRMEITGATGILCIGGGSDLTVAEGTGALIRTRDKQPL